MWQPSGESCIPVTVSMTLHLRHDGVLPGVPDLEVVVDTSGDDLSGILVELNRRDLVVVIEGGHRLSPPGVPHLDLTVVPARHHQRFVSTSTNHAVHVAGVTLHPLDPLPSHGVEHPHSLV